MSKGIRAAIAYLGKQKKYRIEIKRACAYLYRWEADYTGLYGWEEVAVYNFELEKLVRDMS